VDEEITCYKVSQKFAHRYPPTREWCKDEGSRDLAGTPTVPVRVPQDVGEARGVQRVVEAPPLGVVPGPWGPGALSGGGGHLVRYRIH